MNKKKAIITIILILCFGAAAIFLVKLSHYQNGRYSDLADILRIVYFAAVIVGGYLEHKYFDKLDEEDKDE